MSRLSPDSLTAVLAGAAVYVNLMPSLSDVRRAAPDTPTARDVHTGLVMGAVALVGVGGIISADERNPRALWLCGAVAALFTLVYSVTLRQAGEVTGPVAHPAGAAPGGPSSGRWSWT